MKLLKAFALACLLLFTPVGVSLAIEWIATNSPMGAGVTMFLVVLLCLTFAIYDIRENNETNRKN